MSKCKPGTIAQKADYLLGDRPKPRCCALVSGLGDARKSLADFRPRMSLANLVPLDHIVLSNFKVLQIKGHVSFVAAQLKVECKLGATTFACRIVDLLIDAANYIS